MTEWNELTIIFLKYLDAFNNWSVKNISESFELLDNWLKESEWNA